jgi:hypothetical protein
MLAKKKILILSYGYLKNDPRIKRQVALLSANYEIYTAGYNPINEELPFLELTKPNKIPKVKFHLNYPVPLRKFVSALIRLGNQFRKFDISAYYEDKYWTEEVKQDLKAIQNLGIDFDLIISNDLDPLPLALKFKSHKTKVMFDAHEYYPLEWEQDKAWMRDGHFYADYLCRTYLPLTDSMMTVSNGIAEKYKSTYGAAPFLLTNATEFYDLKPHQTDPDKIRLLYHGIAHPARSLELLIDTMKLLDNRFTLDLIFAGEESSYLRELKALAKNDNRIKFPAPVHVSQIPIYTNTYDIGIELIPPVNFNYRYGLGNKFFEFIQARLANAIGPMPEEVYYVEKYKLGIISNDFTAASMAERLNRLTAEEIMGYKQNAHAHALELSARTNFRILNAEIEKLLRA